MKYKHVVQFCSNLSEISKHIDDELLEFSAFIKDEDILFDLRLILNELLINAGKHGNNWDEEKCINYEVIFEDRYIVLIVQDEGEGSFELKPENGVNFTSSGRGLMIVKGLTEELKIEDNKVVAKIDTYIK